MEEIANLAHGFSVALTWSNLGFMLIGILLGVLIGVLPGLGGANGIAILLPLTFSMNPTSAIIMLSCIYWGALFGGAITSILFNIPGEPWSVATTFDGYPMAQQGKAAQALTAAFTSSFVGALFAVALITFLAPLLAHFALKFGPAEFFAVQLLTFASFVGMSREPPAKTLASMMLGFALAAVGMDSVTGTLRMTYGVPELLKGFDFLIAVIGLFGIGEILLTMEEGLSFKGKSAKISARVVFQTWGEIGKHWKLFLRSTAIGCWMGITPGGATPASFMSYGMARRLSKDPNAFGHGDVRGVIAPETAAHAAGTSALLPMLTLGIPGSPTAAVLLGGLLIWGLQPGPMLFVEQKDFVWGLIASMYLGNIVGLLIVLTTVPWWAAILRIPFSVIAPVIIAICAIGAYTVHSAMFDVVLMLGFGVIGYLFKKLRYPLAPLVLALVLGDMAEASFRQSMLLSQGSLAIFWSNPLVGVITTFALVMLAWPLIGRTRGARAQRGRRRAAAMKVAVVGAGAIGGLLGAKLALAGHDVTFVARRRNLEVIRAQGFRLVLEDGSTAHASTATAVEDTRDAGPQDAVILAVKAHQVGDILAALPPLLGPDTPVVTMINGVPWWYFQRLPGPYEGRTLESVDPGGRIARAVDPARVIGGIVYPATELVEPGVVRVIEGNRFTIGELDGARTPRIDALSKALIGAGFKAPVTKDIRGELWVKLWGNVVFNPLSALTHATLDEIARFPASRALAAAMMEEAKAVAEKVGVAFKLSIDQRIAGAEAVGAHKTSMLVDVEHGRALELEAIAGAVVELARIAELPVPRLEALYATTQLLAATLAARKGKLEVQPA